MVEFWTPSNSCPIAVDLDPPLLLMYSKYTSLASTYKNLPIDFTLPGVYDKDTYICNNLLYSFRI